MKRDRKKEGIGTNTTIKAYFSFSLPFSWMVTEPLLQASHSHWIEKQDCIFSCSKDIILLLCMVCHCSSPRSSEAFMFSIRFSVAFIFFFLSFRFGSKWRSFEIERRRRGFVSRLFCVGERLKQWSCNCPGKMRETREKRRNLMHTINLWRWRKTNLLMQVQAAAGNAKNDFCQYFCSRLNLC